MTMRPRSGIPATVALTVLVAATCSGPAGDWRSRLIVAPLYRPPSAKAQADIANLFEGAFGTPAADWSAPAWEGVGFVAEWIGSPEATYLSLHEVAGQFEGKGRYLLRPRGTLAVALQAPHADTDLYTGDIAERLFVEMPVVAAAFSTLPRWAVDVRGRPADLAQRSDSLLVTFTNAFLNRHPDGIVVQLHGFDGANRETEAGATADIVISDGTRHPRHELVATRDCLIDITAGRVRLYPDEVVELGGTFNVIGGLIRDAALGRFVHLEMNLQFRRRLMADAEVRRNLVNCLMAGADT